MIGTVVTSEDIIATYRGLLNAGIGSDIFDCYGYPNKLPLFDVRLPRKLKKRLKKYNFNKIK